MNNHLLFLFLLLISYAQCEGNLMESIKEEIAKISATFPSYNSLIQYFQSNIDGMFGYVPLIDITSLKTSYNLPDQVFKNFRAIAFSQSVVVQSFNVLLENNLARYNQYIGAGVRVNSTMFEFAYIRSNVNAILKPQYNYYTVRDCKRFLFFKKCRTNQKQIQRGY